MGGITNVGQEQKIVQQSQTEQAVQQQAPVAQEAPKAAAGKDTFAGVSDKNQGVAMPKAPAQTAAQATQAHPHLHHLHVAFQHAGQSIGQFCQEGLEKTQATAKAAGHGIEHGAHSFEHACGDFAKSMEQHAKSFWEAHFAKQQAAAAAQKA